eukprot:1432270-Pleurochrysis_carterae.AAC.1
MHQPGICMNTGLDQTALHGYTGGTGIRASQSVLTLRLALNLTLQRRVAPSYTHAFACHTPSDSPSQLQAHPQSKLASARGKREAVKKAAKRREGAVRWRPLRRRTDRNRCPQR